MSITRVFLGWDGPCLHKASMWLHDRYARAGNWDLSSLVLVLPGARAGRRLMELLTQHAGQHVLIPPTIITAGRLPDLLTTADSPVAGELSSLLARLNALRQMHAQDPSQLTPVFPHPPEHDDLRGWLAMARELNSLHEQLAREGVTFDVVADRCERKITEFRDHQRWQTLADIHETYLQTLASHGLTDAYEAQHKAIESRTCSAQREIVLVATADLPGTVRAMLEQVGDRVTALIHAPQTHAGGFDALGCLNVTYWSQQRVALRDEQMHVVDRPRDQAYQVLRVLRDITSQVGVMLAPEDVVVGMGDEQMVPLVQRTLALTGLPARSAAGQSIARTRPLLLLSAMARYLQALRFDDFAALLRHPDIEQYVRHKLAGEHSRDDTTNALDHWLTLLDTYAAERLQGTASGPWLGDGEMQQQLAAVHDAVMNLLPASASQSRPLRDWVEPIVTLLTRVYELKPFNRHDHDDQSLIRSIEAIRDTLTELVNLDNRFDESVNVRMGQAMTLVVDLLSGQSIPHEGGERAIELLGYLELQLDDSPATIITGLNEGLIPQSVNADPLLPDRVRNVLGLMDNQRRYARDLMMLCAILHSRPHVALIAGRRSLNDDPLSPSRLLLACEADALPGRVEHFYAGSEDAVPAPTLLPYAGESELIIPPPQRLTRTFDRLRVTAFRDYIQCPYRFYLKHVLKLQVIDDQLAELDGAAFGTIAHDVLSRFGQSELAHCADARDIEQFLSEQLDAMTRQQFGDDAPAAVKLQREQLRFRLRHFAIRQSQLRREGWRIVQDHIEQSVQAVLDVDGQPFTITGRIDRVDMHEVTGQHRIFDYKTSDKEITPKTQHLRGGQWVDLQLPLYSVLAQSMGITGEIELGYILLPKNLAAIGPSMAQWSPEQLDEAIDVARQIIRDIRAGKFWSPAAVPRYEDGLGGICMDTSLDRANVIDKVTQLLRQREALP